MVSLLEATAAFPVGQSVRVGFRTHGCFHWHYVLIGSGGDWESGHPGPIPSSATELLETLGKSLPCSVPQFPHL